MALNYKGKALSFLSWLLGRPGLQPFNERLHLIALSAMNIGGATRDYVVSGEVAVMRRIRAFYPVGSVLTVIDVGAHKGYYALAAVEAFGPETNLYCFEPFGRLFAELQENLDGTGAKAFNLGLGDAVTELELSTADDLIPTFVPSAFDVTGQKAVETEMVGVVRLDDFLAQHGIAKVHFLKIDVEGYEYKALAGCGDMVGSGLIDFVQFEFGQHDIASRTFMYDFFRALEPEYEIHRVLRNGTRKLGPYKTEYEQFTSATNYLAVNKRIAGRF